MSYYTWGCNDSNKRGIRYFQNKGPHYATTTDSFLIPYKKGERDFSGRGLWDMKLTKEDLSQPNNKNEYLNLSGSRLRGTIFIEANLSNANLSGADLRYVKLNNANLSHANLSLTLIKPFDKTEAQKKIVTVRLNRADLSCANLTGVDLAGAILNQANFSNANLTEAKLLGTKSRNTNFTNSDLTLVELFLTDLAGANLFQANLTKAKLSFANLAEANFTEANLCGTDLRCARIHRTVFRGAKYDDETQFPDNFNPQKHGLKKVISENRNEEKITKKDTDFSPKKITDEINNESLQDERKDSNSYQKILSKKTKNHGSKNGFVEKKVKANSSKKTPENQSKLSQDELQKSQAQANKIGLKGEFFVNSYLNYLLKENDLLEFKWVSQENSISPYDFYTIDSNNYRILIDVKSTDGSFDNLIHISFSELRQMAYGDHQYNIYRIFEINEAQNCAKLKIAEGLKDFAKIILKVFDGLPHGVLVYSISVEPSKLNFSNQSIVINIIE